MTNQNMTPTEDIILHDNTLESNSTFDIEKLNKSLRQIEMGCYENLYKVQQNKVGIYRVDCKFNDFILETRFPGQIFNEYYPKQHVKYIKYPMINTGREEAYRRSTVYGKMLSMSDISQHPELFDHNFLLFIDGKLATTCEVYPMEDTTRVSIDVYDVSHSDGISYDSFVKYKTDNVDVSIVFVPIYMMEISTTSRGILTANGYTLPIDNFPMVTKFTDYTTLYFTNNDADSAMCVKIDKLLTDQGTGYVRVEDVYSTAVTSIKIVAVAFKTGLDTSYKVSQRDPYFMVSKWGFPIPTESMLTFKTNTDGTQSLTTLTIEKYYPNMYKVNTIDTANYTYDLLVFYNDLNTTENEKYNNDLAFYSNRVDMFNKLQTSTLDKMLMEYSPATFVYNEKDYETSVWFPNIINYKIGNLRAFLLKHPDVLKTYWSILGSPSEKYFWDMRRFDLENRIRTDTQQEQAGLDTSMTFTEEHYLFLLQRDMFFNREYAHRIWIDGLILNEANYHVLKGHDFYYIYIPTRLLDRHSFVEIERYRLCDEKYVGVPGNEVAPLIFTPPKTAACQAKDIFVVNNETKMYLTGEQYELKHYSKYLDKWVNIPVDGAYNVSGEEIHIHIIDQSLYGHTILYGVYQNAYMTSSDPYDPYGDNPTLTGGQFPYIRMDVPNYGNYSKTSYRMFLNGHLCTEYQFYVRQNGQYGGTDSVRTSTELQAGDILTLDRVPGDYKTVYYMEEIGENGFVDLDGKIPLPLSFKWYDIYLNGIRLNERLIDFVTPTKCYVHDVNSRKNFLIIERNHDDDVFYLPSFAFKEPLENGITILDKAILLSKSIKEEIDLYYDLINDADRDYLLGGMYSEEALIAIIIFEEFLRFTFFNPNDASTMDILKNIAKEYPDYYTGGVFTVSGNNKYTADLILKVDCNETFKEEE